MELQKLVTVVIDRIAKESAAGILTRLSAKRQTYESSENATNGDGYTSSWEP